VIEAVNKQICVFSNRDGWGRRHWMIPGWCLYQTVTFRLLRLASHQPATFYYTHIWRLFLF